MGTLGCAVSDCVVIPSLLEGMERSSYMWGRRADLSASLADIDGCGRMYILLVENLARLGTAASLKEGRGRYGSGNLGEQAL
jgi:hypothetical protein